MSDPLPPYCAAIPWINCNTLIWLSRWIGTAVLSITIAALPPLVTEVLSRTNQQEKRKRVLEIAEKRIGFWKARGEIERMCKPEISTPDEFRRAVTRIEEDANRELENLVWLELLERQHSFSRVALLRYMPDRHVKEFQSLRRTWYACMVLNVGLAVLICVLLMHTSSIKGPSERAWYGLLLVFTVFLELLFAARANSVHDAAKNVSRPERPLYETI